MYDKNRLCHDLKECHLSSRVPYACIKEGGGAKEKKDEAGGQLLLNQARPRSCHRTGYTWSKLQCHVMFAAIEQNP